LPRNHQPSEEMLGTLTGLWLRPSSCKSNYARACAIAIAEASSLGFITTQTPDGHSTVWRVTAKGLRLIEKAMNDPRTR